MSLGATFVFGLQVGVADMIGFITQYTVSTMSVNDGVASRYGERS